MKNKLNIILAYLFYYLGDISWRILHNTSELLLIKYITTTPFCWLYQRFMAISLDYDEKAGYVVWKEPEDTLDNVD
jgi:hypothetical protein